MFRKWGQGTRHSERVARTKGVGPLRNSIIGLGRRSVEPPLLFFKQSVYLSNELMQLFRILLRRSLLTQFLPTFFASLWSTKFSVRYSVITLSFLFTKHTNLELTLCFGQKRLHERDDQTHDS
jgi:hypothetical protein